MNKGYHETRNCTVQLFKLFSDSPPFFLKVFARSSSIRYVRERRRIGSKPACWVTKSQSQNPAELSAVGVSCLLRILVLFSMSLWSEKGGCPGASLSHVRPGLWADMMSLQTERARLLHSGDQLLVEHGEGGVGREVQTVKASVSPVEAHSKRSPDDYREARLYGSREGPCLQIIFLIPLSRDRELIIPLSRDNKAHYIEKRQICQNNITRKWLLFSRGHRMAAHLITPSRSLKGGFTPEQ